MIAILGATGLIGGALARCLARQGRPLALFARDTRALAATGWPAGVRIEHIDRFGAEPFGTVINAVGAGDPARVRELGVEILDISERWDRRVLDAMEGARTRYVFLSSGAVHDTAREDLPPYTAAKLAAEARHRALPDRAILDLRVFAFADAALDLRGAFFLSELARAVADGAPFETDASDFVRDYVGADDLQALVACWEAAGAPNCALDIYSAASATKSGIIRTARERFGLRIRTAFRGESPTGAKPVYTPAGRAAAALGYRPRLTSLERVMSVLEAVVGERAPVRASGGARA